VRNGGGVGVQGQRDLNRSEKGEVGKQSEKKNHSRGREEA